MEWQVQQLDEARPAFHLDVGAKALSADLQRLGISSLRSHNSDKTPSEPVLPHLPDRLDKRNVQAVVAEMSQTMDRAIQKLLASLTVSTTSSLNPSLHK